MLHAEGDQMFKVILVLLPLRAEHLELINLIG